MLRLENLLVRVSHDCAPRTWDTEETPSSCVVLASMMFRRLAHWISAGCVVAAGYDSRVLNVDVAHRVKTNGWVVANT